MSKHLSKSRIFASASMFCLAASLSTQAWGQGTATPQAQPQPDEQATPDPDNGEITATITGSRIVNVGMRAPTPVTAVSATEVTALAPSTLAAGLSQLPQFLSTTTSDTRSGTGLPGGNFFSSPGQGNLNLRGLNTGGSSRTLTLLDGRRVVPANGYGSVDINLLPSALIQRIDTVTGGASAAYGTDAVAGAVNFILNTRYTGWQLTAQGGTTGHGDRDNMSFSAVWGGSLAPGLHLLVAGEYYHADGVDSIAERDWYQGYSLINNPSTDTTQPRYLNLPDVVTSISTFGGLINSGVPTTSALYRRYFRPDGTLAQFVLGTGTATSAHSITNGGSGDDVTGNLIPLAPEAERASGFVYLSYDAAPNLNLYAQGLIGQSMIDQPDHGGRFAAVSGIDTRITIYRENAFLPAAVRQIMVNEGLQSFQMNLTGDREGLGRESRVRQDNLTYGGTLGFRWEIPGSGLLGGWHVDGYGQYGTADNKGYQQGILLNRVAAATDAVVNPANGQIVCRAALQNPARWGDCVPINLFGRGNASDAAIAYVTRFTPGQTITSPLYYQPDGYASGETVSYTSGLGKVYNTTTSQTMAELSASGQVWDGWAGPISMAVGASYRREHIDQIVYDPSNPASDPAIFPAAGDAALRGVPPYTLTRTSMVQNSTVANVHGSYTVREAFAELNVPLLSGVFAVDQLSLLASARYADYSGSGGIWAWKAGLDWQVYSDLRLRGTVSRDIRAATLLERFNQTGGVGSVTRDPVFPNDGTQNFSSRAGGNPNLSPETSMTYTFGVVFQPRWLPGFSASVDYWDVDIDGAIGSLGFQRIVDDCFASPGSSVCGLITRDATTNRLSQVRNITQNIAAAAGRGYDVEFGYRHPVNLFGAGREALSLRLFWSHLLENSSTTDRANAATYFDAAGQIGAFNGVGNLPRDAVTAIENYTIGQFNLSLTQRYISGGTLNKRFNLPGVRPDLADNTVPSAIYVNLSGRYSVPFGSGVNMEIFATIENLFDKDPPIVSAVFDASLAQIGNQINSSLYDQLGRRFTIGVTFRH